MKRNISSLFILMCFFASVAKAQERLFIGSWVGTINLGVELRVVFHINEDGKGGFTSTADSPDQSAYGLKCDLTTITGNQLTIKIVNLNASYTGAMINDSIIQGVFVQQAEFPLVLQRTEKIVERKRPQTPSPPFPYKSEDIEYYNADKSLSLGATITIPQGKGPFPAILLITGSGPQDRDETIMGHKPFAVIADHLTKKGFIVLRVDDRGVGKSTGDFGKATSEDFAVDASCGVDYLLSRPEVDKKKVGLIGHSEGGMIAPIMARKRADIDFMVLMAAPGVRVYELMAAQNEAIARSIGVSEEALKLVKPFFLRVALFAKNETDSLFVFQSIENWSRDKDKKALEELHLGTAKERRQYIIEMYRQFESPWFRYFMSFHPWLYLRHVDYKLLAINGDKDIQVNSSQNLGGIATLKILATKTYETMELKGLNHLFQTCKKCTVQEYGELEETFSPVALQAISDWLEKNVK